MRIAAANSAALDLLGQITIPKKLEELEKLLQSRLLVKTAKKVLRRKLSAEIDLNISEPVSKSLKLSFYLYHNQPTADKKILVILRDLTETRRLEAIRRDFVANVSHELKTPITSIKGFAETLLSGSYQNQDDCKHFLEIILKQANRIQQIIEDLLSIARLEQGGSSAGSIKCASVNLHNFIKSIKDSMVRELEIAKVELEIKISKRLKVRANKSLLEQALVNLIENAIKYGGPEKTITIAVKEESERKMLRIKVIDQGIGIEQRHLPRLFERFYRVDAGRSRETGGTGLGLAIVKHIALVHGGAVEVESKIGKGSAFSILLPL